MMREKIGDAAMYEQLAEECTELAKAALKVARYIRGENPTGREYKELYDNFIEECIDVGICFIEFENELSANSIEELADAKMKRFEERWEKFTSGTHTTDS